MAAMENAMSGAAGTGAVTTTAADVPSVPPNMTIYINNLNEKIKIDGTLRTLF